MKQSNLSRLLQSPLLMALVKFSPWVFSFYCLRLVTTAYFLVNSTERKIIRSNMNEVLGASRAREEVDFLFRSTLKGVFYHYFEKLFLACTTRHEWKAYFLDRIHISRRRLLDRFLAKNQGVILVTAHFGAVEFLPGYLALLGYPIAIVAKFKTQRLKTKCEEKARTVGARIIDANEKSSFFLALSALKEGRILITQCDEVDCWKASSRRTLSLFGTTVQVDRTVSILWKRSGAPVLFGHVRRTGEGQYIAEIEDLFEAADGTSPERLDERILKKLEQLVYTNPDQWYIWKNFQRMKASGAEGIAVEDRKSRDFPTTPTPVAVFQLSQRFSELHG